MKDCFRSRFLPEEKTAFKFSSVQYVVISSRPRLVWEIWKDYETAEDPELEEQS